MTTRILVVDDNAPLAQALADSLDRRGHQTVWTSDGKSALATAGSWRPHVAIVDLFQPGMGGAELSARLLAHGVKVILMSGVLDKVPSIPGIPYVSKPIDVDSLSWQIHALRFGIRANTVPAILSNAHDPLKAVAV